MNQFFGFGDRNDRRRDNRRRNDRHRERQERERHRNDRRRGDEELKELTRKHEYRNHPNFIRISRCKCGKPFTVTTGAPDATKCTLCFLDTL